MLRQSLFVIFVVAGAIPGALADSEVVSKPLQGYALRDYYPEEGMNGNFRSGMARLDQVSLGAPLQGRVNEQVAGSPLYMVQRKAGSPFRSGYTMLRPRVVLTEPGKRRGLPLAGSVDTTQLRSCLEIPLVLRAKLYTVPPPLRSNCVQMDMPHLRAAIKDDDEPVVRKALQPALDLRTELRDDANLRVRIPGRLYEDQLRPTVSSDDALPVLRPQVGELTTMRTPTTSTEYLRPALGKVNDQSAELRTAFGDVLAPPRIRHTSPVAIAIRQTDDSLEILRRERNNNVQPIIRGADQNVRPVVLRPASIDEKVGLRSEIAPLRSPDRMTEVNARLRQPTSEESIVKARLRQPVVYERLANARLREPAVAEFVATARLPERAVVDESVANARLRNPGPTADNLEIVLRGPNQVAIDWDPWHARFNEIAGARIEQALVAHGDVAGSNSVRITVFRDHHVKAELESGGAPEAFDIATLEAFRALDGDPRLSFPEGSEKRSCTFVLSNSHASGPVSEINATSLKGEQETVPAGK